VIMNCKQIREAIDTASHYNPDGGDVASHLSGCPDCHRYSDETLSLLRLLDAQPRVEAPMDFEFRLRARMVRAQSASVIDPQGFLRKIRPEMFSWGRMVAAAAALALVATVSTFYVNRNNYAVDHRVASEVDGAVSPRSINTGDAGDVRQAPGIAAAESAGATPVRFKGRNMRVRSTSIESEVQYEAQPEIAVSPNNIAGIDDLVHLYSPETKRLLKDRKRFYGAEPVSFSLTKPAAAALTF
jgi:hypothetical protein